MPPFFDRQQKRRSGSEVLVPISRPMAMFRRNVAVCLKRWEFDGKIITSYDITWALAEYAEGREDYFVKHRNSKSEKIPE